MRTERLLRIAHLLQARGKLTAPELARELGVSPRTIHRDMEGVGAAGIPVFATRGVTGGWELVRNYRTALTSLSAHEVLSIVLGRQEQLLAELGFSQPGDARLKVLAATTGDIREYVNRARQLIHFDGDEWDERHQASTTLADLQHAVWNERLVEFRYARSESTYSVAPLGLVAKG